MVKPSKSFTATLIVELALLILVVCAYFFYPQPRQIVIETPPFKTDYKVIAAGDIACSPLDGGYSGATPGRCQMNATAELAAQLNPDAVLALGDLQYEQGEYENFMQSYEPSWGKLKTKTFPVIGNHEYLTSGGAGFKKYFADFNQQKIASGNFNESYYSFNIGDWHLVALNSNCSEISGCGQGSPQYAWLESDLANNQQYQCTLAYWHHPRFTSGIHTASNETELSKPFWELLTKYKAELIINGHDHVYERFAPQTVNGLLDVENGVRQFTSGAGGKSLYKETIKANNREFFDNKNFGVLELTLSTSNYSWGFHATTGITTDSGTSSCH